MYSVGWSSVWVGSSVVLLFPLRNAARNLLGLSHTDEVPTKTACRNVGHEMVDTEVVQVNLFRVLLTKYRIINRIMIVRGFAIQPRMSLVTRQKTNLLQFF